MTWGSVWPAIWESEDMYQRALLLLTLCWALIPAGPALAQDQDQSSGAQASSGGGQSAAGDESAARQDDSSTESADTSVLDQPGGVESASEETDSEDGEAEGPGRFIPSEQISQDLGVSFPADI